MSGWRIQVDEGSSLPGKQGRKLGRQASSPGSSQQRENKGAKLGGSGSQDQHGESDPVPEPQGKVSELRAALKSAGSGKKRASDVDAVLGKFLLQLEARTRELEGINLLQMAVLSTVPGVEAAKLTGMAYAQRVKEGGASLGSPHLHMFGSFLEAFTGKIPTESMDQPMIKRCLLLKLFYQVFQSLQMHEAGALVKTFKVFDMFKDKNAKEQKCKIVMCIEGRLRLPGDSEVSNLQELVAADPPSAMRQIAAWEEGELVPVGTGKTIRVQQLLASVLSSVGGSMWVGRPPKSGLAYKLAQSVSSG